MRIFHACSTPKGQVADKPLVAGLNLSEVVGAALEAAIREAEGKAWLDENRDATDEYNALVARRGVFSDGRRRF
jgi:post-segregation antitoxin (ccd killing protein)